MRILFYVGYQSETLDSTVNTGGGTEIAIINIAKEMVKFGYEVIISGMVKDLGKIDGVIWMSTENIHSTYYNNIDIIVSASYIHFISEFKDYTAKKIFWAHNTHPHVWWKGIELNNTEELLKQPDMTVCLTQWHADQWSNRYGLDRSKIRVIGNGIDTSTFIGNPVKIKDKFIWSSDSSRGLFSLLENWRNIKQIKPNATLDIYSPAYSLPQLENLKPIINVLDDVTIMGNKTQKELHDAMLRAEYWCYITNYEETYCITALEMQYAKVIPITSSVAALKETINAGVICEEDNETNWNSSIISIGKVGPEIKQKVINANHNWSKRQTWDCRSYEWKDLIEYVLNG
mgnify:CR=1 FL=1